MINSLALIQLNIEERCSMSYILQYRCVHHFNGEQTGDRFLGSNTWGTLYWGMGVVCTLHRDCVQLGGEITAPFPENHQALTRSSHIHLLWNRDERWVHILNKQICSIRAGRTHTLSLIEQFSKILSPSSLRLLRLCSQQPSSSSL